MSASDWAPAVLAVLVIVAGLPALSSSLSMGSLADGPRRAPDAGVEGVSQVGDGYGLEESRQRYPRTAHAEAEQLHERGVTGDGVTVGVIGSDFDADHPSIEDDVVAARRFAAGGVATIGLDNGVHDTAVAEIVSDTAPQADLLLASVGEQPTVEGYREAVRWLIASGAEVVVDAGSYFPPTADTRARMSAVVRNATRHGVIFVTSAGNYAERHWAGNVTGAGWVEFADGTEANPLGAGAIRGAVSLRLYWRGAADVDLYLYRVEDDGRDTVVAKSETNQSGGGRHTESVRAEVPRGRYYVAVYARNVSGAVDVQLFSTRHRLAHATANGSMVAPATVETVITVGATDEGGGLSRYSSRDRLLDVSAPETVRTTVAGGFRGTSAAAPYVAGTAALMEARGGDLEPTEVERILERTARTENGTAEIDPIAAVSAVESLETTNATTTTPSPPESGADDGE